MINFGNIPDWITAISTLGALIYLGIERCRTNQKASKDQASHISTWLIESPIDLGKVCLLNKSNEPVFEVIISVVTIQGAGISDAQEASSDYEFRLFIGVLPPGSYLNQIKFGGNGMMMRFALEIAFTDCFGKHWVRKGNGRLIKIKESPTDYYKLTKPIGWNYV